MCKICIITLFILFLSAGAHCQDEFDPHAPVDITYEHSADFDRDGADDRLLMHITGESMYVPLKWTLDIISGNDTLLHHFSDDSRIDSLFAEYCWPERPTYLSCKRWWYFIQMAAAPFAYSPSFATLDRGVKAYLEDCCDLSDEQVGEILITLQDRCDDANTPYLVLPICPPFNDLPKVYVDEINEFVFVYRP